MSASERQQQLLADFAILPTWDDKLGYLLELGKDLPPLDPALRDEAHRIGGCQSNAWLASELVEGRLRFRADAEGLMARGIMALVLGLVADRYPVEILREDFALLEQIGLREHLSMNRAQGLDQLIAAVHTCARQHLD